MEVGWGDEVGGWEWGGGMRVGLGGWEWGGGGVGGGVVNVVNQS